MELYLRAFLIWTLIAVLEVIHGILRARFIAPMIGDLRSRQVGVFSGSLLFFAVTLASFDWMRIDSSEQAFAVGGLWLLCMLVLEFSVGRFVFHFGWKWLFNDFNFFKGRLLAFGMVFLALSPYLVGKIRNLW
ncbi:MAG: hypothetical protein U1E10_09170 [Bdellovibrionales bacterium]|nr:hypothetical protein [Bdellovibrionales bacterium]